MSAEPWERIVQITAAPPNAHATGYRQRGERLMRVELAVVSVALLEMVLPDQDGTSDKWAELLFHYENQIWTLAQLREEFGITEITIEFA